MSERERIVPFGRDVLYAVPIVLGIYSETNWVALASLVLLLISQRMRVMDTANLAALRARRDEQGRLISKQLEMITELEQIKLRCKGIKQITVKEYHQIRRPDSNRVFDLFAVQRSSEN